MRVPREDTFITTGAVIKGRTWSLGADWSKPVSGMYVEQKQRCRFGSTKKLPTAKIIVPTPAALGAKRKISRGVAID